MNFVFGALLLTILLLPGVLFRVSYLQVSANKFFQWSITEEILIYLVLSLIIHIPLYAFVHKVICPIDPKTLYLLLINSDKIIEPSKAHFSNQSIFLFFGYITSACLFGYLLGTIARSYILANHLDLKYAVFKIRSDWQNYFEGYILDRPDTPGSSNDVKYVHIDALIKLDSDVYLYSGFLDDYVVTKDEKLERIYLRGVRRRKLNEEIKTKEGEDPMQSIENNYYWMPGEYFMIPGTNIININITYYSEEEEEES